MHIGLFISIVIILIVTLASYVKFKRKPPILLILLSIQLTLVGGVIVLANSGKESSKIIGYTIIGAATLMTFWAVNFDKDKTGDS